MNKHCLLQDLPAVVMETEGVKEIPAYKSGLYQGFEKNDLLSLCEKHDATVCFLHPVGSYLIEGSTLLTVSCKKPLTKDFEEKLRVFINIHRGQEIETSYYYGFSQLMEIAVKALSPGINDPGTAVISLQALADLLSFKLLHFAEIYLKDKENVVRVIVKEKTFEEIFNECILPIWDYGKNDRLVQQAMVNILTQLKMKAPDGVINALLLSVRSEIAKNN